MTSPHSTAPPRPPLRTRLAGPLAAVVAGGVLALAAAPIDTATALPGSPDGAAGRAVDLLTGPHPADALAALPADFATHASYRPVLVDGVPARADGGCSSPVPLPARFEPACRTHDLGYDLLRYAADAGRPLGPWARARLDAQLAERMRATCADDPAGAPGCAAAAETAAVAVSLNSARQLGGVPGRESAAHVVGSLLTFPLEALS